MSRDIADRCVGTSLTLSAWSDVALAAGGKAAGLVAAAAVECEAADEAGRGVEADVVVSGDDQDALAVVLTADADEVAAPGDVPAAGDEVEGGSGSGRERVVGEGWWAGGPAFCRCGAVEGPVGSLVVVEGEEGVELALELGGSSGQRSLTEPFLECLVEAFELPAGLGVAGAGEDVADAESPHVPFEAGLASSAQTAAEAGAVVRHDMGRKAPVAGGGTERPPGRLAAGLGVDPGGQRHAGVIVEEVHDPDLLARGQCPAGGVDLPGVVWSGPLEAPPRRPRPLVGLRSDQAPADQRPVDRADRRHRPAAAGQVIGDGLSPVVEREVLSQPDDLVLDVGRHQPR